MPIVSAIYPGTFDPITNAHLDLIQRGLELFDEVIVAIAPNPVKGPTFTTDERVHLVEETLRANKLDKARVESFEGLLVDYVEKKNCKIIIRGLRAVSDFEYEFQMALMNRKLAPDIETIFLMPSESYTFLSSHMVKEVCKLGGDVSELVPNIVNNAMKNKFFGK